MQARTLLIHCPCGNLLDVEVVPNLEFRSQARILTLNIRKVRRIHPVEKNADNPSHSGMYPVHK